MKKLLDKVFHHFIFMMNGSDFVKNELLIQSLIKDIERIDKKRLEPYGFKVYSQNDEDGIIQEIFRRIGVQSKIFVEFGASDGMENNSAYLLMQKWEGLWIEGNEQCIKNIKNVYREAIDSSLLKIKKAFITKDNINSIISQYYSGEIDLLSIDIDGNDFYIWENIKCINPRVVIVEYNGKFPPPCQWIMRYNENHIWDGSDKHGMSLQSATDLGNSLGYELVGTNINGVNAFFVRKDLLTKNGEYLFSLPATAEYLFNRARYFLKIPSNGHNGKYYLG